MRMSRFFTSLAVLSLCIGAASCDREAREQPNPAAKNTDVAGGAAAASSRVAQAPFGKLEDGRTVELFTLTNTAGMQVQAMNYGGIITSIKVPDRNGALADVTLGFDRFEPYLKNSAYLGAIIGRYANRIGGARFTLDDETYKLPANNGPNTLHGGDVGFDKALWTAAPFERPGEAGVVFTHTSPDGDQGFPGAVTARVTYTLNARNELSFDFHATTDEPTVINLTQHAYFNLAGDGAGDVLNHELVIHADRYTPVDENLIPTGELASVAGTPFDFRTPTAIGARIDAKHPQLELGKGYDHNYVLNRAQPNALVTAARVEEPQSGRVLEVRTTEPGMQLYTGNHLDASIVGKSGRGYAPRSGFCLETQHYPDSPNKPQFPSTVLRPGEEYRSRTVYAFSVASAR